MVLKEMFFDILGHFLNFVIVNDTNELGLFGVVLHMAVMGEDNFHGGVHFVFLNIGNKFLIQKLFDEVVLSLMVEVTSEPEH